MPNPFVSIEFSQSETALAQEAILRLQTLMEEHGYVGWSYSESDLEIILVGVLAGMALNAAQVASVVPQAIFRSFGTQLLKVPYNEGSAATGKTKWVVTSSASTRYIPAGTQIEAYGQGFLLESELTVPPSTTELTKVNVVAIERGTTGNKVTGVAGQVNPLDYVLSVEFEGETSGGEPEENDQEYLERLASYLVLQAPRPITATNFAEMTLLIPEAYTGKGTAPIGLKIGRATCIDGYSPESAGKGSGNAIIHAKTNSSTELTEVEPEAGSVFTTSAGTALSLESAALPQKHPGSELHWKADGSEYKVLPKGTTAVSRIGSGKLKISTAALKSEAKGEIEVKGLWGQERTVTVFVAKSTGNTAAENEYTSGVRELIKEYLEERRELNFLIYVEPASYNEIRVATSVHVLPGYTEETVKENVKSAIETFLSPGKWGNPNAKENVWFNATQGANIVRYNQLLEVIGAVTGVQYVLAGSTGLSIGLEEAPGSKTADLTMTGPAPLPFTKESNIIVTAA